MRNVTPHLCLLGAALGVAALAGPARAAEMAWDGAPFSASPAAVRAAADALDPPEAEAEVLLDEGRFAIDGRGAVTAVHRTVFRPLQADAVDRWSRVEVSWSPWRQARPRVRARVIGPDGGSSYQDPVRLTEAPTSGPLVKVLQGAVVGVVPGAVVELEITERDEAPAELPGVLRFALARPVPVRRLVVVVEAPEALPLRAVIRGRSPGPADGAGAMDGDGPLPSSRSKGMQALRLVRTRVAPVVAEPSLPADAVGVPHLALGWARSWGELAQRAGALWSRGAGGAGLAAAARAAVVPGRPGREERVRRATAWVHRTVHITAPAGLGGAPLRTDGPAATLRRGTGDARDAALLLAAVLRQAGLAADLVLVAGADADPDPRVPGLGFDRVVVRVAGTPELWIDPAAPEVAPGRLPAALEGRTALALGPGGRGRGLFRTPVSTATENRLRTVRELRLAPFGRGTVVETRALTGGPAATERALRAGLTPEARDDLEQRYAHASLRGDDVTYASVEGQDDPAAPLTVKMEVRGSGAVQTEDEGAELALAAEPAFGPLVDAVAELSPDAPRRGALALAHPFQAELVYRVIPPDGFRVQALPPPRDAAFGPIRFTLRSALDARGVATATFRVDCPAARLSAADAQALAEGLRALAREPAPIVRVERVAAALLAAGRAREGLAELARLGRLDPSDPVPPGQLALALLKLGLQREALEAARDAVSRSPRLAWAVRVLGFVLEHDGVGRFHGRGYDRAGALAAYRRARALDPGNGAARAQLAELLAHGEDGALLPARHLADAIAEYESIRRELGAKAFEGGRLALLAAASRWDEVEPLARELPEGEDRDAALVAAVAVLHGAAEAEEEARALGADGKDALARAAYLLVRERRHALAAALARAAARGATEGSLRELADVFARLGPWEARRDRADEAERLVLRIAAAALARDAGALRAEVADDALPAPVVDELVASLQAELWVSAGGFARQGLARDVVLDVLAAQLTVARRSGPAGLTLRVGLGSGREALVLQAVKRGGGLKVVASDGAWPALFAQAERRAVEGDAAAARALLELGRELLAVDRSRDGPAEVLRALWPAEGARRGELARAAAALAAYGDAAGRTAPALEAARAAAPPAGRRALSLALAEALHAGERWEELRAVSAELLAADPTSRRAFALHTLALTRLGDAPAVEAAARALLARGADDPTLREAAAAARLGAGDLAGAAQDYRALAEAGRASSGAYNDAAWLELFQPTPDPRALDWAQHANAPGAARHATLNTLAALQAVAEHPAEAREAFLRSLAAAGNGPPGDPDWLVQGLIAEACGLPDAARAAYARIRPDPLDPSAPYLLAQRRLAALEERSSAPAAVPAPAEPPAQPTPGKPAKPEKPRKRPHDAGRNRGSPV